MTDKKPADKPVLAAEPIDEPQVPEIARQGSTFASRAAARLGSDTKRIGAAENKAVKPADSLVSSKTIKGG